MSTSSPYESTGRIRQKARTRAAMVAATRELLAEGTAVTVENAAERAAISRTTAYRYFPNQRALVLASYPELDASSLLDADAPADPAARLELVTEAIGQQLLDHELELRAMLRLSLETPPANRDALPLRQGRAIGWIADAVAPLRDDIPAADLHRLVLAIRATLGIEALAWLRDIAGLTGEEAVTLMRSSARTLLQSAVANTTGSAAPS